jgi:hypothetical protein
MIWQEIWEEIEYLEDCSDREFGRKVMDVSLEKDLHPDDDREEILDIIAEEMMEDRAV